jgi:hypothetical protein
MSDRDDRRLKVCFIIPSLAGGGAERVAVQVLNALSDERWDRSMYLFEGGGPYVADLSPSIRLEVSAASSRLARWRALRGFVRRARPDVIVAFLSYLSVVTAAPPRGRLAGSSSRSARRCRRSLTDADYRGRVHGAGEVFTVAMRIGVGGPHRGDLAVSPTTWSTRSARVERACGWSTIRWI